MKTEFEQIALRTEIPQLADFWTAKLGRLRRLVLSKDPRAFLTWDVVAQTMFPPPYASFARIELAQLRSSPRWNVWKRAIKEQKAGLPMPCLFYPLSSSNAIHHAYHLYRFETATGTRIEQFGTVLEFGAGYGSLCRIAHRLGFKGKYLIFDVPELCALQRYYLRSIGAPDVTHISELGTLAAVIESSARPLRLFVATWSLSEAPLELRKHITPAVEAFDAFLIAYQNEFFETNNSNFFAGWQAGFPHIRWTLSNIPHLPGNTYLFGTALRERSSAA